MSKWMLSIAGAMLFSGFFLAAPATADPQVYLRFGPPTHRMEMRRPPRSGFVWRDGHYRWNGRRYVWVDGRYMRQPFPNARWSAGRWDRGPRGFFWVPGRWR